MTRRITENVIRRISEMRTMKVRMYTGDLLAFLWCLDGVEGGAWDFGMARGASGVFWFSRSPAMWD